jgi:3-dehydroquinate dehydratase II
MPESRVEVMHGVNLDTLGGRDPEQYGSFTLAELEETIAGFAKELGLEISFFQSNHEGEFVEHLHSLRDRADALIINAGAWSHYSRAIGDALEFCGVPAVEVHISDVSNREAWRQETVFEGLTIGRIYGKRQDGYREALELIAEHLKK